MDSRKYTQSQAEQLRAEMKSTQYVKRVQFMVTPRQLKQIKRLASKDDRSLSAFVRNMVINAMKLTSH